MNQPFRTPTALLVGHRRYLATQHTAGPNRGSMFPFPQSLPAGYFIHILLVVAVAMVLLNLIQGRRSA